MVLAVGTLRDKVTVKQNSVAADGLGGQLPYVNGSVTTTWAKVLEMTGRRALEYGEIVNGKPYDIWIRKRSAFALDETYTLVYDSKDLTIHSVTKEDEFTWHVIAYSR